MAVTMAEITKLRKISGAGMMQNVLTVKHQKVVYWLNQQVNSLQSLH